MSAMPSATRGVLWMAGASLFFAVGYIPVRELSPKFTAYEGVSSSRHGRLRTSKPDAPNFTGGVRIGVKVHVDIVQAQIAKVCVGQVPDSLRRHATLAVVDD